VEKLLSKKFFSAINVGRYSQPNSMRLVLKIALEQLLASGIRKRDLSRSRASIILSLEATGISRLQLLCHRHRTHGSASATSHYGPDSRIRSFPCEETQSPSYFRRCRLRRYAPPEASTRCHHSRTMGQEYDGAIG
jgi:hypothetical protein